MLHSSARPLRFLALILTGWALTRAFAHWDVTMPLPPARFKASFAARSEVTPSRAPLALFGDRFVAGPAAVAVIDGHRRPLRLIAHAEGVDRLASGSGHHDMGRGFANIPWPTLAQRSERDTANAALRNQPELAPVVALTGAHRPYWAHRQLAGWSLGGWAFVRPGEKGATAGGIAAVSQLGGSQAGLRLAYGFGDSGSVRAYGRATMALDQPRQREVAVGVALAPVRHLPIDIAVEQRLAVGSQGRTALAVMAVGGVGDVALPAGFRFDAYGQIGFVGARRRDGFADAAVVVDREVVRMPKASLHLGALAAGSVQPGAARVDVGPRLTLRLPDVGKGSRIALDWRQRVAGDATPGSGVALTLAADF